MPLTLALVRHGRANGQGPEAELLPEGAGYVATLGRRLRREGLAPSAAASSPYLRARETMRILLGELASDLAPRQLSDLTPDVGPERALDALLAIAPASGTLLVVTHMPLVARLTDEVAGEIVDFHPGTFAEIQLNEDRRGWLVRRIGPEDL
jgi:phosphohistidine phosphatase SixA